MSSINANNINSINATITNLYVQTINGIPASKFGNCCSCQDICPQEDDYGPCPQCQSYDNCSCPDEPTDDGGCPECIPYEKCNCSCHGGGSGAQGFQGYQGYQGYQGKDGGGTGAQGFQGYTGAQGFQGYQGYQGVTGAQGVTGGQGYQGYQGVTGAQGFQGVTGPANTTAAAAITFYFDPSSGVDTGPGTYGTLISGSVVGPGYNYYNFTPTINNGALLYPVDNYFNLNAPGQNPFANTAPSAVGQGIMKTTQQMTGYVAPYSGNVVRVAVNSAYSKTYFNGAKFDFIILNGTGNISCGGTTWSTAYTSGQQQSGWSTTFANSTSFTAGDILFCYIVDPNNDGWGAQGGIPLGSDDGYFNITLYLNFS